jgi:hypothetical protein
MHECYRIVTDGRARARPPAVASIATAGRASGDAVNVRDTDRSHDGAGAAALACTIEAHAETISRRAGGGVLPALPLMAWHSSASVTVLRSAARELDRKLCDAPYRLEPFSHRTRVELTSACERFNRFEECFQAAHCDHT